ncbi:MAG: ATP-binding cassette domain-containing protein [Syntrophorhabdaceae bacterium]|nr:ATP-binding cassette domain-containing protein [Syntrophorhabdaceae bacterium]
MVNVTGLSKSYGPQVIFDSVNFSINRGEKIGLVGRNGSGKTTLLRILTGLEEPDGGEINIPKGYVIKYLSQHIDFKEDTVLEEALGSLNIKDDGRDDTYKVKSVLFGLGFSQEDLVKPPKILSGGFQVRLNLAKILLSEPDLILLDEPTNYLDIVSVRWLTGFLRSWKREAIIITHDRTFMDGVITHTMGIHRKRIRKVEGPTEKLYQQIIQEEEVYEKTRINDERKIKEANAFIERFRAQATRAKAVQSRIKMLERMEKKDRLSEEARLDFEFNPADFSGKWVLEAQGVSFGFDKSSPPIIKGFTIAVRIGEKIGIIGKNGKGKTTLLNIIAGELSPDTGTIRYSQNTKIAYYGQPNINRLNPDKTVFEEILSVHPSHNINAARGLCGAMMFEGDRALKKVSVLSGGERSRLLLGKIIATPTNLLLLDEPDTHLDAESIDALIEAMENFPGTILFVTHNERILKAVARRLIVFDRDNVTVFPGPYEDFLEKIGWEDERGEEEEKKRGQATIETVKKTDKKELRRRKALIIEARSRVLKPIQGRISLLEEEIMGLEKSIEEDNETLIRATRTGNGQVISALHISIYRAKERIEALLDELDLLNKEYHRKASQFEREIEEIEGLLS